MGFALASLGGFAIVVLSAYRLRGRLYAAFAGVVLAVHTLSAIALWPAFGQVWPLYLYLHAAVYLHFLSLIRPRLRPWWWRALLSIPAMFFVGGTFLALPWAVASATGLPPWGVWGPFALALLGVGQGLWARETVVDLTLDGRHVPGEAARRYPKGAGGDVRPLQLVQITDPHLGPWMSEHRLRRICARAVAREPDLVVLTGDLLTMESQHDAGALARALAPLRALQGRTFAIRGNHDLEAPQTVATALAEAGVRLLVDEAVELDTAAGPVQLVGIDFRWRGRARHVAQVCGAHPRIDGALRLVLLHDPSAFRHVPSGEADLVLSGHTHGGQLGLVSFGLPWTLLSFSSSMPDHGFWALGSNRLYVHRGTGHYGFPLRVGVPAEHSLLRVHGRNGTPGGSGQAPVVGRRAALDRV